MRPLALLATLFIAATAAAQSATLTQITVTGEGSVAVTPDQATVRASIETTAERAQDAVSQSNTTYAGVVRAVLASGVARSDITLAYYNLTYNPRPQPVPNEPAPVGRFGYTVTRTFDVKVRDLNKTGTVVDALSTAGVTNVESVTFTASNTAHARTEATTKAMADARAKAQDAARAAGLHISGVKRITLGGAAMVQPLMRAATMAAAPTVFDQGSVNVNASLTVVFLAQP